MTPDAYISSGVLELYVAGVLTPEQAQEVAHMASQHPRIQEEIEKLEKVYREYAQVQADFPSHLFDNIVERIEKVPEPPAVETPPAKKQPEKKAKPVREPERKPEVAPAPTVKMSGAEPAKSTGSYWRPLLAAAMVLFVLSALLNGYLYDKWQKSDLAVAELQKEKLTWDQQLQQAQATQKASYDMLAMYDDTNYRHVMMKGQAIAPKAMAMVFWNKKENKVILMPKNLPAPPEGKQYQLWAIDKEGKPVDAGMLPPDETIANAMVPMKSISEAQAFAVSLEPLGGSASPTTTAIYVVGAI